MVCVRPAQSEGECRDLWSRWLVVLIIIFSMYCVLLDYYVRLVYNDVVYPIPGCQNNTLAHSLYPPEYCPFPIFQQLAQLVIPQNWAKECQAVPPFSHLPSSDMPY